MNLYSILACPTCKTHVERQGDTLVCAQCNCSYPIVNGVPILLPGGEVPITEYQHDLKVRSTYDPWLHRVVLQSLPANATVLDLGAGNLTLDLPNVIRMDVTLTPYVDVVGDAHMLPFLPDTLDFIFSLAVIEHLRNPFEAAQETHRVLRNGGYVYGECNFVFAYHGYPHHYFNASQQGLEQVFNSFEKFRSGVAPYQMPSEALRMVIGTYLHWMQSGDEPGALTFRLFLQEILNLPLGNYDSLFTEEGALNVAAGVFFFGRKQVEGPSEVVSPVVQQVWEGDDSLRARFPSLFDIGSVPNIMLWAKGEGREQFAEIDAYFRELVPFSKRENVDPAGREHFAALPVIAPEFGYVPDPRTAESLPLAGTGLVERLETMAARNESLARDLTERDVYIKHLTSFIDEKVAYIRRLESTVKARDAQIRSLEAENRFNPVAQARRVLRRRKRK
ncbi:MAG: methyltransferase domain-containing protein [Chloroflexota bacterium]|nr:methyltransferase domain-containing protein [Chloroflexota bacterium]